MKRTVFLEWAKPPLRIPFGQPSVSQTLPRYKNDFYSLYFFNFSGFPHPQGRRIIINLLCGNPADIVMLQLLRLALCDFRMKKASDGQIKSGYLCTTPMKIAPTATVMPSSSRHSRISAASFCLPAPPCRRQIPTKALLLYLQDADRQEICFRSK